MSSPAERLIRVLVEEYGYDEVRRIVTRLGEGRPQGRRRRTLSRSDAARKAAEGVPVDELAKARARRER